MKPMLCRTGRIWGSPDIGIEEAEQGLAVEPEPSSVHREAELFTSHTVTEDRSHKAAAK